MMHLPINLLNPLPNVFAASSPPPSSRGTCEPGKGVSVNGAEPCPKPLTTCKPKQLPGQCFLVISYQTCTLRAPY